MKRNIIACLVIACLIVATVFAFELTCPSGRGWNKRALTQTNCSKIDDYTCLFDEVKNKYTETCSGPKFDRAGHKKNMNKGNFNRAECSLELYQPVKFSTIGHSDCLFLKSFCSEEGQVVVYNGLNGTTDRNCSCDYRKGYAFISKTYHPCHCIPSEEDCSCYRKRCGPDEVLSPDYECVAEIEQQDKYQCLFLLATNKIKPEDSERAHAHPEEFYDTVYIWLARKLILSGIIVFTVLAVILLFFGKGIENVLCNWCQYIRNRLTKLKIVTHLENRISCMEGENVKLTCEVNKKYVLCKWMKDGHNIKESDSELYSLRSDNMTHELMINNVTKESRGKYTVTFNGQTFSNTLVIVVEQMITGEMNYLRMNYLLEKVAEPVVRKRFNVEFNPECLEETLKRNDWEIKKLKKHKHINRAEFNLMFPKSVAEYSIELKLKNIKFPKQLEDKNSDAFKKLSNKISEAVTELYSGVEEMQDIKVVQFQPGLLVTLTMTSKNSNDADNLRDVLKKSGGSIPPFKIHHTDFSFTYTGESNKKKVSSQDFDIRLMMILMRNLIPLDITDVLPVKLNKTDTADLSRIKFYRNKDRQNSDKVLTDDEFNKDWDDIFGALVRLGGKNYQKICDDIKSQNPSPEQCQEYYSLQPASSRESIGSYRDFFIEKTLRKNACRAVKVKFNEQIPPPKLKEEITKQLKYLEELKENKEITQYQWQTLFPDTDDPSSARLELKIMMFLLKKTALKDSQIFRAIENLCNHCSKTELDYEAVEKEITFIDEH